MKRQQGRPALDAGQVRVTVICRLPAWLVATLPSGKRGRAIEAALIDARARR